MTRTYAVRAAILYMPLAAAVALWLWRRPERRVGAGVLLAVAWNLWTLTAVHLVAVRAGWWTYGVEGPDLLGLPADVLIGWTVWWGAAAVLVPARLPLVLAGAVLVDLAAMPAASPVVRLGPAWLLGEVAAVALCLVPGLLLARWTAESRRLSGRVFLQLLGSSGVMIGLVLAVGAELRGLDPSHVLRRSPSVNAALVGVLIAPALLAFNAVREFYERGRGTPLPYDPPQRLVTTGPYAYVSSPMQLGMLTIYVGLAFLLWAPWLLIAAGVGLSYAAGLAAWHEDAELTERFGERWTRYRRGVRRWWPRWRPVVRESPSQLYVAVSCVACSSLGRWVAARRPVALDLLAAEDAPELRCERLTYLGPDGYRCEGVAALGRALEHVNLGWAVAGWILRLPIVCAVVQLIGDAVGAGPRRVWVAPKRLTPSGRSSRSGASMTKQAIAR